MPTANAVCDGHRRQTEEKIFLARVARAVSLNKHLRKRMNGTASFGDGPAKQEPFQRSKSGGAAKTGASEMSQRRLEAFLNRPTTCQLSFPAVPQRVGLERRRRGGEISAPACSSAQPSGHPHSGREMCLHALSRRRNLHPGLRRYRMKRQPRSSGSFATF